MSLIRENSGERRRVIKMDTKKRKSLMIMVTNKRKKLALRKLLRWFMKKKEI